MRQQPIATVRGPLHVVLEASPSKSVTHRALVVAALARGRSVVRNPLRADDGRVTRDGLRALGIPVEEQGADWIVTGCGGIPPGGGTLALEESGSSARFLLAVAALGRRPSELDGAPRLRERPLHELSAALQGLGARVRLTLPGGGLPARAGGAAPRGGACRVASGRSSQFASALLLVGSQLPGGIDLTLEPPVVSLPYVELTEQVLDEFGVQVERPEPLRFTVRPTAYPGRVYRVEGDHSSASYFLAAAAIVGGRVRVNGLAPDSRQPDARLGAILERVGCRVERGIDWIEVHGSGTVAPFDLDMGEAPDLVPTLAALALFADGRSEIRGVAHLRHKESDRLEVLASNLRALGREARADSARLVVDGRAGSLRGAPISTASDHRIAMAFAVAGLRVAGIELDDADCVAKSNPDFWRQFERLRPAE